jgi:hypothetical protein
VETQNNFPPQRLMARNNGGPFLSRTVSNKACFRFYPRASRTAGGLHNLKLSKVQNADSQSKVQLI